MMMMTRGSFGCLRGSWGDVAKSEYKETRLTFLTFHFPLLRTWPVHRGNTPPASSPSYHLPSSSSSHSSLSVHLPFLQTIKRRNMELLSVLVRLFLLLFLSLPFSNMLHSQTWEQRTRCPSRIYPDLANIFFPFAIQLFLCCVRVFISNLWICSLTTLSPF